MAWYIILGTLLLIPLLSSTLKVLLWLLKVRRIRKAIEVFTVTKPHWIYGHLREHPGPNERFLQKSLEWMEKAPAGCYTMLYPLRPTLVLCHPDTVKVILQTSEPKGILPALGWSYWMFDSWLGNGLLTSNGDAWFKKRCLLTPAFQHSDILKDYTQIFNESVEKLMAKFEEKSLNGKSVEIYEPVSLCTLNSIMRCAFNSTEDVQAAGDQSPYVQCVWSLLSLSCQRVLNPLYYFNRLYFLTKPGKSFLKHCRFSHSVTNACINKRRETMKEGKEVQKRRVDFLDLLLLAKDEDGNGLTQKQLQDEVTTFMFAGHDTTTTGLSMLLYNMARHPQYQTRAREEVDEIMQGKSTIALDDISRLTYLTRCLQESLRLYPPVTFVQRELSKPITINGQRIEVGTPIEVNIWSVHHNRRVWGDDCMTYNPDRFLPVNMAKMDNYAFVPFSGGPRNCIGQVFAMNEMKACMARILHRFELRLDENHCVEMCPEIVNRPKSGIKIFFSKRQY